MLPIYLTFSPFKTTCEPLSDEPQISIKPDKVPDQFTSEEISFGDPNINLNCQATQVDLISAKKLANLQYQIKVLTQKLKRAIEKVKNWKNKNAHRPRKL